MAHAAAIPAPAVGPLCCGIPIAARKWNRPGGEPDTTNNRMELTAAIMGLETLKKPSLVQLVTDSVYVGKGISEWLAKWKSNGWKRREGKKWKPVANEDLWRRLDVQLEQHRVVFKHVRGHTGHPENERCDELAVAAYQQYR